MNFTPTPHKSQGATLGSTPAQSRFRSSLVPMSRPSPARPFQPAAKPTGTLRTTRPARDLFGTTTPKATRSTQFAPTLSPAVTKAAAGARKFASGKKNTGAGMAATTSTELFKMRIPEPDPDLTGEALAKSIPEALTRKGTVYADQYLADKCPPQFDDLQRRQFFCILDLRRLKHAANEIFAKKDWKLNILNFAKEYEKSRGLIMLHYGLYEFKNVKPSEEVMRRWRAAHGLPNPEPEKAVAKPPVSFNSSISSATPGLGKRKADDDLQPRDNALKASTANQNKKRNVEVEEAPTTDDAPKFAPSPTKSKRKTAQTGEDADESQRNKMQKTPSSARSRLEGIINNVQSGSTTPAGTPLKRPALDQSQSLFASKKQTDSSQNSSFAVKANPFASTNGATGGAPQLKSSLFQPGQTLNGDSGSVLSGHKFGVAPAAGSGNIFGYLSESSAPSSGNEKEDADDEPDPESESENEQGSQEVVPSEEPSAAASTGTATPPIQGASSIFNLGKPTTASAPFGASTKPAESTAKGGLFGRVSFGSDGQPLRAASAEVVPRPPSPAKEAEPEPAQSTTPAAKVPGDFTFNPATTPINFSSKGSLNFAPKPAAETALAKPNGPDGTTASSAPSLFGAKPAEQPPAPSATPSSQPLFGNSKPTPEPGTSTLNGGSAQSIFGTQKPASTTPPVLGTPQKAAGTEPAAKEPVKNIFGALGTPQKTTETEAAKEPAKSIFGTPAPMSNANPAAPSTPLFGALKKPSETGQSAPNGGTASSIFSNGASTPSTNILGASAAAPGTSSLSKRENDDSEGRSAKRSVFGRSEDPSDQPPKRGSLFGTSQPDATAAPPVHSAKPIFGGSSSLFGSTTPKPDTTAPASSFTSNASATAPIFSFGASAPSEPKRPDSASAHTNNNIFGTPAPAASTPSFTFGAQGTPAKDTTTGPSFTFGTQSTPARDVSAAPSPVFSFGGTQASAPAPSFGGTQSTAAAPSFGGFGSQANGSGPAKIDFNFSGSSAPGGNSSSFVFGGDQNQTSNTGSFTFTAGGPGPSNTNGQSFGGTSTTPTPAGSFNFQFGGPSTPKPAEQGSSFTFGSQPNEQAGAPGFSFTSSTPQAAPPKASSIFSGLLQPGGGSSTGASK